MTLIDLFREFSQVSTTEGYPLSSRILFYTVMYIWNERRRPEVLEVSTEKLYTLAGLPESTFRDALQFLTARHWMKRVKSRRRGITALWLRDRRENAARCVIGAKTPRRPLAFHWTRPRRERVKRGKNPPPQGRILTPSLKRIQSTATIHQGYPRNPKRRKHPSTMTFPGIKLKVALLSM